MSNKLAYERFTWLHEKIKASKYPNANTLSEKFEVSPRTAQRDIEFMRDRLNVPLEYSAKKRGYFYNDSSYELPPVWFTEDSIIALSLAVRLASSIPDSEIKQILCNFLGELFNQRSERKLNLKRIADKVSVKNVGYSKVNEKFFHQVIIALFKSLPVLITYYSPHKNETTNRTILPLHLIHYMGSWHVVAFCTLRNKLRDFALSRIKSISEATTTIHLPDDLPDINTFTKKHFGIIQGGKTKNARLKFAPSIANWIKEQVFHPNQNVISNKDGSLIVEFPVADIFELKRQVLGFGSNVKVIKPKELAAEIKEEIIKMNNIY